MRHDSHYVDDFARASRSVGRIIPINQIAPNPEQPRVEIGDLTELSSSIKQNGVLEPLLVKPNGDGTWMIIAGERRWRAANLVGLTEVPCIELDIDEKSIAEIALIENLQRKDLTIWEEADGFAYLIERFGYTHEEISKKIGKSRTTVTESMAIAGLPESIRIKCRKNDITAKSVLLDIARQFDEQAMHDYFENNRANGFRRTKNVPKEISKQNTNKIETETTKSENNNSINKVFKYSAADSDFVLQITFSKNTFEKNDVLRALKETFTYLKNFAEQTK